MGKKITYLLILLTALSSSAFARQRVWGWCEQGGQPVVGPGASKSTTLVQRSYPQCTVTVYEAGTTTPATIYSDDNGTPLSNPFMASTTGYYFFYADIDIYDVQLSGSGFSNPVTLGGVIAFDPTEIPMVPGSVNRGIQSKLGDIVSVADFGAEGDGTTNDTAAINAAVQYACLAGGGRVYFPSITSSGQQANYKITSHINLGPACNNVTISGYGARITLVGNDNFFWKGDAAFDGGHYTQLTANIVAGDTSLTVQSTSEFVVGQDIYYRLNNIGASPSVRDFGFAKVTAIPDATHLTLDQPLPFAVNIADQTMFGKLILSIQNYELNSLTIEGLRLTLAPGSVSQGGIYLSYARNADVRDITCDNAMTGCVIMEFTESSKESNVFVTSSRSTGGAQSTGRVISIAACKNITINNVNGYDFDGQFAYFEEGSKNIYANGLYIHDTATNPIPNLCFVCVFDESQVYFDGVYVDGVGHEEVFGNNDPVFDSTVDHLQIYSQSTNISPAFVPLIRNAVIRSGVSANMNGNTFDRTQTVTRILYPYANTTAAAIGLPAGILKTLTVYTTSTTGLVHLYIGIGSVGHNDVASSLTALHTVDVTGVAGLGLGPIYPINSALTDHTMIVYTDGTWVPGNRLIVRAEYMPPAIRIGSTSTIDDESKSLLEDTVMYVGTITTTAANSDALPVPNLTFFSKCTWSATNTIATGMVTAGPVYITQSAADVFLNHPQTAGGTFNISCQGFF